MRQREECRPSRARNSWHTPSMSARKTVEIPGPPFFNPGVQLTDRPDQIEVLVHAAVDATP